MKKAVFENFIMSLYVNGSSACCLIMHARFSEWVDFTSWSEKYGYFLNFSDIYSVLDIPIIRQ